MVDSSPDRLDTYSKNINAMPTPDSAEDSIAPMEKTRGRPRGKSNVIGKGKARAGGIPTSRAGSVVSALPKPGPSERAAAAAAAKKRPMMEKQRRMKDQQQSELDEPDELDVESEPVQQPGLINAGGAMVSHDELDVSLLSPAAVPKKSKVPRASKVHNDAMKRMKDGTTTKRKQKILQHEEEEITVARNEYTEDTPVHTKMTSEYEEPSMALDESVLPLGDLGHVSELDALTPRPAPKLPRSSRAPSEAASRVTRPPSIGGTKRKRADGVVGGTAITSDNIIETSSTDPTLRRKLGDVTRRYENLENKHRKLREIGIKEAEVNFERLKKQMQEKSDAAEKLISSLKSELTTQTSLARETKTLQTQLSRRNQEFEKLQSKIISLTTSLQTAETENKNLSAKLAASRASAAAAAASQTTDNRTNTSNSAIKRNGIGNGGNALMNGNNASNAAAAAEVARIAQTKENLYSDLTGLILPNVKKTEEGDVVVDCIQTGRNGSLHFKLTLLDTSNNTLTTNKKGGGGITSYEDQEFLFTPLLDPHRDRALMEVLPEYLQEEINFMRGQAEKFYEKVVKCLTQTIVEEDDDGDSDGDEDGEGESRVE
ncbi:MAG: hypothetical protein M1823_000081 [Watsoniomyces obsoletus]|nr:MAG: hypothetical protein M1823_000081 [Watsoniomyces obsoletus]